MVQIKRSCDVETELSFEEDDCLLRKWYGESLANLITNSTNESLVISINADWGEWKSYFLNMWKKYLESERKLNVIYFDAFKNDFIEDPFIPLLWEILKTFWEKTITKNILEKWKNVIKWFIPLVSKVWVRWIMKWDNEQIDDDFEKLFEWDIVNQIEKKLEKYIEKDSEVQDFKESIEKIIQEKWQLVFIIDELDRCRPDFALRLLERIKHFFDIKWLYFVLWVNKEQLKKYIENIYWNIDSNTYLQKFIDIETILPKVLSDISNDDHYNKFIKKCLSYNSTILDEKLDSSRKEYVKNLFIDFSKWLQLSLRDIEKVNNYLTLFYKSLTNKNHLNMPMLTFFIIIVKVFDIKLYKDFKEGNITKDYILKLLKIEQYQNSTYKEHFLEELSFIFDEEMDQKSLESYKSWMYNYDIYSLEKLDSRKKILNRHFNTLDSFNL